MAKLYGTLQSEKTGKVTRSANSIIASSVQSYDGSIGVSLNCNGIVQITVGEGSTDSPSHLIAYMRLSDLLNKARQGWVLDVCVPK